MSSTPPANSLLNLLDQGACHPVLVDVGAGGRRHKIWDLISSRALIIGFDPDLRQADPMFSRAFGQSVMINKAVIADERTDRAEFNLTAYPACSSLLEPDQQMLSEWSFGPLFRPVGQVSVGATSLNRVVTEYDLGAIDWLKLDTQGCDLKILDSLSPTLFDQLLVVDVEPGFSAYYRGEDRFADVHASLQERGFWLADIKCQSYAKVRGTSLSRFSEREAQAGHKIDVERLWRSLPPAPTAAEARYLRTVDAVFTGEKKQFRVLNAFVFALLVDQPGYALDLFWAAHDDQLFSPQTLKMMYKAIRTRFDLAVNSSVARKARRQAMLGRIKGAARQLLGQC